jgi:hypothetical protein
MSQAKLQAPAASLYGRLSAYPPTSTVNRYIFFDSLKGQALHDSVRDSLFMRKNDECFV